MAEAKANAFSRKSLYLMEGAVATQRVSSAGAEETQGNVLQTVSLLKKRAWRSTGGLIRADSRGDV